MNGVTLKRFFSVLNVLTNELMLYIIQVRYLSVFYSCQRLGKMSIKDKIIQMLDKADERTVNFMYVYIRHLLGLE